MATARFVDNSETQTLLAADSNVSSDREDAKPNKKPILTKKKISALKNVPEREGEEFFQSPSPYRSYLEAKLASEEKIILESNLFKAYSKLPKSQCVPQREDNNTLIGFLDYICTVDANKEQEIDVLSDQSLLISGSFLGHNTDQQVILPITPEEKKASDASLRSKINTFRRYSAGKNEEITSLKTKVANFIMLKGRHQEEVAAEREITTNAEIRTEKKGIKSVVCSTLRAVNNPARLFSVNSVHHAAIGVVLAESAYDVVENVGAVSKPFMHSAFFSWGMPILLATLAFEGFSNALIACLDKKTEDRGFAILEGLNKGINSTLLFVLRMGLIPATAATVSYLMPTLFFVIVAGMIAKEERLLRLTQKKISKLEGNIAEYETALQSLNLPLDSAEEVANEEEMRKNAAAYLKERIAASKRNLAILKVKERHLRYSKWGLHAAFISIALLAIAAAFPPLGLTAIILTTTALAIFFMVVTAIRVIKKNEQEMTQKIKSTSPAASEAEQRDSIGFFSKSHPSHGSDVSRSERSAVEKAPEAPLPARWSCCSYFTR